MKAYVLRVLAAATVLTGVVVAAALVIAISRGEFVLPTESLAGEMRLEVLAQHERAYDSVEMMTKLNGFDLPPRLLSKLPM
jgi:hypothetical protein